MAGKGIFREKRLRGICFRDEQGKDNEVRVTLHHKEQELILFPEKMSSGYY